MNTFQPNHTNTTTSSSSRKMRRSRDAGSPNDSEAPSAFDLYTVHGDAAGALNIFQQHQHYKKQQQQQQQQAADDVVRKNEPSNDIIELGIKYNCMLLSQISSNKKSTQTKESVLNKLDDFQTLFMDIRKAKQMDSRQLVSSRRFRRNEFILSYNRMLVLYASGDIRQCALLCTEKLFPWINHNNTITSTTVNAANNPSRLLIKNTSKKASIVSDDIAMIASRMAFLMFECVLSMAVGRNQGLKSITDAIGIPPIDVILEWLESLPVMNSGSSNVSTTNDSHSKDPQLKFLFSLYKSRLALADLEDGSGKHVDSHIRSARKDMKTAMEFYQHKLRSSFGSETSSVVSSANSEENLNNASGNINVRLEPHQVQQQLSSTPNNSLVLQKLNQSALSLKAHLEQLKGNTKKSLILCGEAFGSEEGAFSNTGYDAVHSNNLALVYETSNKRRLALHALAKSLRFTSLDMEGSTSSRSVNNNNHDNNTQSTETEQFRSTLFHSDGTIRPNIALAIIHNSAICAMRARNFAAAYECIATCVSKSEIFFNRPSSWLRMAEACVGIWSLKTQQNHRRTFNSVYVGGKHQGIVINSDAINDDFCFAKEEAVSVIGSPKDLEQVKRNPLIRARACLEYVLQYHPILSPDILISARVSAAYVYLAFGIYPRCLELCKLVIETKEPSQDSNESSVQVYKRLVATARLYAAEASCAMRSMVDSMAYLVGDGSDDALDRLAADLSGLTIEMATANEKGKNRLAKAQTMVRSSACAVTAAMGNLQAAKQLANSANAMEELFAVNRERSFARRALLYALLREGHDTPALTLLLSLRP